MIATPEVGGYAGAAVVLACFRGRHAWRNFISVPRQLVAYALLIGLGMLVILLQTLAKSV